MYLSPIAYNWNVAFGCFAQMQPEKMAAAFPRYL